MIFGIHDKAPGMEEIFRHNAVCWLGTKAYVIRYEDMIKHLKQIESRQAELYFAGLFDACGINMPADWRARAYSPAVWQGSGKSSLRACTVVKAAMAPAMSVRMTRPKRTRRRNLASAVTVEFT